MIKIYIILMMVLGIGFLGVRYTFIETIRQYFGKKTYLSLAAVLAAGFVVHNSLYLIVFASMVLLVTGSSRLDAMCRMTIFVTMAPEVAYTVFGGGIGLATISTSEMLCLVTVIACLVHQGVYRPRPASAEDFIVLLLVICFGIGASRDTTATNILRGVVNLLLQLGLPYFVYRRFIRDRFEFAHVIGTLAGAAMILGFVAICEARFHWSIFDNIYSNQAAGHFMSTNTKMRAGLLRAPASFADSTAFAVFEVIGIFAVIASRRFFRSGMLWSGGIAVTIFGLLAAQSRGADLGLMVGLFVMVLVRRRYAVAATVAGGGAGLVALLLALASVNPTIAAFIGADNHAGTDQDYRQLLLRRGLEVGMEHPILGDGIAPVLAKMADITQGEGIVDLVNTYLTIFLNSGLVGLGILTILVMTVFAKLFRRGAKGTEDEAFIGLQMYVAGALGGVLTTLAFTSFIFERNYCWLLMLLAFSRCVGIESRRSVSPVGREPEPAMAFSDRSEAYLLQSRPLTLPGWG